MSMAEPPLLMPKLGTIKVHFRPSPFLGTAIGGGDGFGNSRADPIGTRKILATPVSELVQTRSRSWYVPATQLSSEPDIRLPGCFFLW